MSKQIEFSACYSWFNKIALKPIPASTHLPQWFKSMSPYVKEDGSPSAEVRVFDRKANTSPKKCVPMLDALTSGYLILLWADIFVDASEKYETPLITWKTSKALFEKHGTSAQQVGTPEGFHPQPYKYLNYWRILTPPGYSTLITQPHGFQDSNLRAISAVVDTDKSSLQILPPLWVKKGFVGVIEKGTPIIQVTPFRRENWEAKYTTLENDNEYENIEDSNFNGTIINHYLKNVWFKKSYK
jgi:hypothetical protein